MRRISLAAASRCFWSTATCASRRSGRRRSIGLTKLLTNDDKLAQHVAETQHPNLWLLASGPIPPSPADLLSTGRFRAILAEAAEQFDIAIVDAPPALGLADAPLLAAATGHVMFVVQSGRTRTRAAIEAINRIEATGATSSA